MEQPDQSINALLQPYTPFRADLFHAVRPHVTDEMLVQISRADYGMDQKEHLAALMRVRNTGRLEAEGWIPGEVLGLCAHDLGQGQAEHHDRRIIRVFCNATLLSSDSGMLSSPVPGYNFGCLLELLPTIKENGGLSAFQNTVAALLMYDVGRHDMHVPLYGLALLLIGCDGGEEYASDEHLIQLIEWVSSESHRLSKSWEDPEHSDLSWLLGWTAIAPADKPHPWLHAVHRLLIDGPPDRPEAMCKRLHDFGQRFVRTRKPKR